MSDKQKPITEGKGDHFDLSLLSNFIHQVINPLNGVAGTLDNLAEGKIEDPGRRAQRLNVARRQLEQCISLVRNLAYFAQGFGALDPNAERVIVVPQVVIEAAMFFQEEAENKGIRIELADRKTQNMAAGRPELIRQVFMNLFDNAVKYSATNSVIHVNQRIQKKTGKVFVEVISTMNIPLIRSDLPKIFDLGFRGENARKTVASGTGLGLHICKRIVEEVHGGEMWAELINGGLELKFNLLLPKVQR
jgi:signal transduction histidine kinase